MDKKNLAAALQDAYDVRIGSGIIEGKSLSRKSRETLTENGWLSPIMRGWYILHKAESDDSLTGVWFSSYWDFLKAYLNKRFKNKYCLGPVESLAYHSENNVLPSKLNVYLNTSINQIIDFEIAGLKMQIVLFPTPLCKEGIKKGDLRVLPAHIAISHLPKTSFEQYGLTVRTLLSNPSIKEDVARYIEDNNRNVAKEALAELLGFQPSTRNIDLSPAAIRVKLLWEKYAATIDSIISEYKLPAIDFKELKKHVSSQFARDSYNSLSIEGYAVSPYLIKQVESGEFTKGQNRDELAAIGYRMAHKQVSEDILKAAPELPDICHWRMLLFKPEAEKNNESPIAYRAYRDSFVFIRGSDHVPVNFASVRDCMDVFKELTEGYSCHAVTRAVLAHIMLAYIHPWGDGNGRVSRFLMNYYLCTNGMPWLIITPQEKQEYFKALETGQAHQDIEPFARFILSKLEQIELE
ncbi:MAG: Fic family protein [Lentisphaeraceae bacterium]|nr:Fic family protein [Lentisphaeraceae bacterium]